MNKKLLALYGLKWNPFAPDVPVEALCLTPRIESFCWRVEQLAGTAKSPIATDPDCKHLRSLLLANPVSPEEIKECRRSLQ